MDNNIEPPIKPPIIKEEDIMIITTPINQYSISPIEQKTIRKQDKFKKFSKLKKIIKKSGLIYDVSRIAIGVSLALL